MEPSFRRWHFKVDFLLWRLFNFDSTFSEICSISSKESHCLETYIQCLSVKKYQQAISRFRVSSHRLGIELGRHYKKRLPVEQRQCNFCNSRNLDDELHFLIKCEFHTNTRKTFYLVLDKNISNFESLPDDDKFRAILTSPNEDVIFSLGKSIHDGFKSRELFQRNSLWNIFNTGFNSTVLMLNLPVYINRFSFSYYFRKT